MSITALGTPMDSNAKEEHQHMTIYQEKYGFVYIWYDRKHQRYYLGCHWGHIDDGYICSSTWMNQAYNHRPQDFKRKILNTNISSKAEMYLIEKYWLSLIKPEEISPNTKQPRYYNLNISGFIPWHASEENIKTVGQKISSANTGKKRPCTSERAKAVSEGKTKAFAKRQEELGYKFTDSHVKNMAESKKAKNRKHTDEWKAETSKRVKEQWDNGTRKRAQPKTKMTPEEQAKLSSDVLKSKWLNPVWKENQRKALSKGAKTRPPRSEESKLKARMSQLGKSKNQKQYLIMFTDGTDVIANGLGNYAKYSGIPMSILSGIANGRFPKSKTYNIIEIIRL